MAAAVWRSLKLSAEPGAALAGTGAVLEKGLGYRQACARALKRVLPGVELRDPHLPAVAGAVLLALQVAGVATDGAVLARLRVSTGA